MSTNLARWFAAEMADLPTLRPDGWAVMGFPIWGAKYFGRFEFYALASMLAPENHAALTGAGAALVLWTEERGRAHLLNMMAPLGIEHVVRTIPQDLLAHADKYRILAVCERLLVRTAAKNGRGYSGVFPDCIYSQRFFPSLAHLSRHHPAIAHVNLTAEYGRPALDSFNVFRAPDRTLNIPARELGDIGYRHLHPIKRTEVRDELRMPACHFIFWRGADYVRIHSPHANPAWISPELCRRAPSDDGEALQGLTLDAALPAYMGPTPYHTSIADEMVITDLYELLMRERTVMRLAKWPAVLRSASRGEPSRYLPYFTAPTMVPIHPRPDGLSDREIERQVEAVMRATAPDARLHSYAGT